MVHVVPEHVIPLPVHPANTSAGELGVAVKTTEVPLSKLAEHVVPQLMPSGALVTEPDPAPARNTVNREVAGMKLALTTLAVSSVTVQLPTPLQPAPLHPANTEAGEDDGVAVNVTVAPDV